MAIPVKKILISATAALSGALALAACGGSAATTSTSAPARTTTAARPTTSTSAATTTRSSTTSLATSSHTTSAAGPPLCRASGLTLRFLGGQGATGHGVLGFALHNAQSTSCRTYGYPGVQFLSRSGAPLPTLPTHTTDDFFGHSSLQRLIVAPGGTVSFRLGVTHGSASSAGCTTAHALQVIPPDDTATLSASITGGAYECGTATVSPLQAGTSAYP